MTLQITLYEGIAILILLSSLGLNFFQWISNRRSNLVERRQKFFQTLIEGFYTHNWKFIEHWDNEGVRPQIDTTADVAKSARDFGRRVVLLDHLNILREVFLHRSVLHTEDIDSFKSWAKSWVDGSKDQMEIIFKDGDLLPLDYIVWLRDEVFVKEKFNQLMGRHLVERIQQYEVRREADRRIQPLPER